MITLPDSFLLVGDFQLPQLAISY